MTEIRISVAKTINIGNFNSIRIEASVTAQIEDGDNLDAVKSAMQDELGRTLEETYRTHRKGHDQ